MRRHVYKGYIRGSLVGSVSVGRRCRGAYRVVDSFDGLFDFVMLYYADDVALMRLGLWCDEGV